MTTIRVEIDGLSQLTQQLGKLTGDADKAIMATIQALVVKTQFAARQGIGRGTKSGRVYRRGGVTHQASAPGQYPASDTGRLLSSVQVVLPTASRLEGEVGTNVMYGRFLEFGTSRMAARPWLLPSFIQAQIGVEKQLRQAIEARL